MARSALLVMLFALAACDAGPAQAPVNPSAPPANATPIPMAHAETFRVYERAGYRIVDFKAPVVSWGGDAKGGDQHARVVLVPDHMSPPELTGDLAGAVVVRTPVQRVAVNYGFLEAMLTNLDAADRLVAVGGVKSYNDAIRSKSRAGELAQIGYGWHSPPDIAPLLGSEPDVFFMVLGDLGHAEHYQRIKTLGVPVVPVFLEAETHYLGPVEYMRLLGMFTGLEAQAEAFATMVEDNVAELKARVADRDKRSVLSAWYAGSGRWMVTVRNAESQLMEDAGGINLMAQPDDIRLDDFTRMGSESLLEQAQAVDCWVIRDSHSQAFTDTSFLGHFKAWQDGCLFASDGSNKPEADAFDIYETGPLRPDLLLRDFMRMLHPDLVPEPFVYLQPDQETPRS